MVEIADGQQVTLSKLLAKDYTYQGKELEFKKVDADNPYVYVASTKLSDEELAAGNNNVKFTFSIGESPGVITKTVEVMDEKERQKLLKKVLAERQNPSAAPPASEEQPTTTSTTDTGSGSTTTTSSSGDTSTSTSSEGSGSVSEVDSSPSSSTSGSSGSGSHKKGSKSSTGSDSIYDSKY